MVLGIAMLAGCGRPSTTVAVVLASHGQLPAGLTNARFTLEDIKVLVDVPDEGPTWRALLEDEEGARTFDLAQLGQGLQVAQRDVPRGALLRLELAFDTDEAPAPGVLPMAPGVSSELQFDLTSPEGEAHQVVVDFDAARSVAPLADGGYALTPSAAAEVTQ